jgi:transposase
VRQEELGWLLKTSVQKLTVKVLAANRSDQQGAKRLLEPLRGVFARLSHLWGDSAYGGPLIDWVAEQFGWTLEIVRPRKAVDVSGMHPCQVLLLWDQLFPARLRLQPKRWIVERSLAWMVRWRRLCCDHEGLPESSESSSRSRHADACSPFWLLLSREPPKPYTLTILSSATTIPKASGNGKGGSPSTPHLVTRITEPSYLSLYGYAGSELF